MRNIRRFVVMDFQKTLVYIKISANILEAQKMLINGGFCSIDGLLDDYERSLIQPTEAADQQPKQTEHAEPVEVEKVSTTCISKPVETEDRLKPKAVIRGIRRLFGGQ